jgi:hypothetical protein
LDIYRQTLSLLGWTIGHTWDAKTHKLSVAKNGNNTGTLSQTTAVETAAAGAEKRAWGMRQKAVPQKKQVSFSVSV